MNHETDRDAEECKAPPPDAIRRDQIVQALAQTFETLGVVDERPQPKKKVPDHIQQRLINQAEERRKKKQQKRLKQVNRQSRVDRLRGV